MVERFGYSLDVGKSLESEDKEETKEETVEEEPLKTPTGEDLSADSVEKDILDDIKEDIEVKPENAEGEDEDKADELPKEEKVSEGISADKFPPIVDEESAQEEDVIDEREKNQDDFSAPSEQSSSGKEELDEFEEPMPDKPEEEPAPEPEKPPGPEEEDVKEMVDESFKTENASQEAVTAKEIGSDDDKKGFGWRKWGLGIAVVLVLAVIVFKLGFVGVVDNNPTAAIPIDDDIDAELEEFFEAQEKQSFSEPQKPEISVDFEVVEEIPEVQEEIPETDNVVKKVLFENGDTEIIEEPEPVVEPEPIPEPEPKEKDPDQLLDLLKEGLN